MRILGIDPGLATVGFSIIDVDKAKMKLVTCGIISTRLTLLSRVGWIEYLTISMSL